MATRTRWKGPTGKPRQRPPIKDPRTAYARTRLTPRQLEVFKEIVQADGGNSISDWIKRQAINRAAAVGIEWPEQEEGLKGGEVDAQGQDG